MIEIKEKVNCSGCAACYNICPKNAIEMKEDEEGFLYPEVDQDKCIHCNLCDKVCPIINKKEITESETTAFVAYNKNDEIRNKSAAGGIFSALGEKIIDMGGVVFGAYFNEDFEVLHGCTDKKEDLKKFSGSKYVQSVIGDSYRIAKKFLEDGRYVLFSGTPCQIAGLKRYLGKDYDRLYLVDIVCKGVPSPKVVRAYKKHQEKKYHSKINYMSYREKTYGATSSTMSLKFENGKKYNEGHESDFILGCFLKGLLSRPSCYKCQFKTLHRISDITLGDVWNVEKLDKDFCNKNGNTALLVHTDKGKELIMDTNSLFSKQENLEDVLRVNANSKPSMITETAELPEERAEFFNDLNTKDFSDVIKKYYPKTINKEIKSTLKKILFKLGLLEKIKKVKK